MKCKKIWPIILIVIIIAVAAGVIIFNSTDGARFRKQLNLGQRYLSEMNYEEAVVAFNQAIEINPRNADAYLGLADAYIGLGDEEAALAALKKGYEATGDERLKAWIDEMEAEMAERGAGTSETAEESDEITRRLEEIYETIFYGSGAINSGVSGREHFLAYDQIEKMYRPLAEELEIYLEQEDLGESAWLAWEELACIYLHLGEMEQCLEARRKGYEATGWDELVPDIHESGGMVYDEYGRIIKNSQGHDCTYDGTNRRIAMDGVTDSGDSSHMELEYDDSGRIAKVIFSISGENGESAFEDSYEYQDSGSVIVLHKSTFYLIFVVLNSMEGRHINENKKNRVHYIISHYHLCGSRYHHVQ